MVILGPSTLRSFTEGGSNEEVSFDDGFLETFDFLMVVRLLESLGADVSSICSSSVVVRLLVAFLLGLLGGFVGLPAWLVSIDADGGPLISSGTDEPFDGDLLGLMLS